MKGVVSGRRGFTLLELMMTVAVLGIFFGVVYGFLNHNLSFMNERGSDQDYQLQGRIAMSRIENLLRRYQEITVDPANQVVKGDGNALIDYSQNTSNISGVQYFFYWDAARSIGELRNGSGDTVAKGVKLIDITDEGASGVIKVTVQAVPAGNPADPGQTLSTRLRKNRTYSP
ncbi:MAG: PulJ/GspJ family protein [Bacillota bacterium]